MTPKEKAEELVDKFKDYAYSEWHGGGDELTNEQAAKECSLIAVDEIISNVEEWDFMNDNSEHHLIFWNQVKDEINKL